MNALAPPCAVKIELPVACLDGDLALPGGAKALVVFVHGSGSSRHSSRNRYVAAQLAARGFATLLFDLLTEAEDRNHDMRFDIPLLTQRLVEVTDWIDRQPELRRLALGYFGASTGAAAALAAAARSDAHVAAVVSRGGRPDLAMDSLPRVRAPVLLIVGGADAVVLDLNRQALDAMSAVRELRVIEGATHLFEEPGALSQVADLAADWFERYCLDTPTHERPPPP